MVIGPNEFPARCIHFLSTISYTTDNEEVMATR